jgi:hypothetical protein
LAHQVQTGLLHRRSRGLGDQLIDHAKRPVVVVPFRSSGTRGNDAVTSQVTGRLFFPAWPALPVQSRCSCADPLPAVAETFPNRDLAVSGRASRLGRGETSGTEGGWKSIAFAPWIYRKTATTTDGGENPGPCARRSASSLRLSPFPPAAFRAPRRGSGGDWGIGPSGDVCRSSDDESPGPGTPRPGVDVFRGMGRRTASA